MRASSIVPLFRMQLRLAVSLQRRPVRERDPVTTRARPPSFLISHQPTPPLLVRLLLVVGIFNALGLARPTLVRTPLRQSLGRVLVGYHGCTYDAWPRYR